MPFTAGPDGPVTRVLSATVLGTATYVYLPFEVPPGTARVDVRLHRFGR